MNRMQRCLRRQQGGTVTGLIVGLIIGLLVAVGVAMTIMKTPLPFVDKIGRQSQPAGELGDPNKTLQGGARERRERLEADVAPQRAAPAADAPAPAPAPAPQAEKGAPVPSVPPANTAAPAATAAPAGAAPAAGEGFTYYLQAGAFREQADAEATKGRLAMMGVAASIAERKSELGTLYRVRVGPFNDVDTMNRARARLSDNGVDAAVVRVPK